MATYVTHCDDCVYYNHGAMLCTNPDGPYGEDCDYTEEDEGDK